ncbi:MAG: hypothetical protein ACFFCQ_06780 [Promethearchaeota archaeon]
MSSLKPWELSEEVTAVCVNYHDIKKHKRILSQIFKAGVRETMQIPPDIALMIDSGAYPAFKSKVIIKREELLKFYQNISKKDENVVLVNLDVIDDEVQTRANYEYFYTAGLEDVLPVVHFPHESVYDDKYTGLGGLVPVVRTNKGKIEAFSYIAEKIRYFKNHIHVFGLGSTLIPVLNRLGVYSCDWIGWRISASIGAIQITRQCHISGRKANKWGKGIKNEEIEKFIDPSPWNLKELTTSFVARAAFNLWFAEQMTRNYWGNVENRWIRLAEENRLFKE